MDFAAPGYRDYGRANYEGGARRIGNYRYSWSSTVNDSNGVYLGFNVEWVRSCGTDGHAYGFQLRCLSE